MTRRILILGAAGSGKSYFARQLRTRWRYSVYLDTQHQEIEHVIKSDVATDGFWNELRTAQHIAVRLDNADSLDGWYNGFLSGLQKLRARGFNDDVLLVAEESGFYGLSHYNSNVQVFNNIILRSRMWHSTVIILHDLHQAPSVLLNAGITDFIIFRQGPSKKNEVYMRDRYPAAAALMPKVTANKYSYVHYDVVSQRATWQAAIK